MRLKRDHESTPESGASCSEYCGDLGRVMRVVVHDQHTARLAMPFEPTLGAFEDAKGRCRLRKIEAELASDGNRREGVLQVVPAGYRKLEHAQRLLGAVTPAVYLAACAEGSEFNRDATQMYGWTCVATRNGSIQPVGQQTTRDAWQHGGQP
jgi:hypothetical protein